jgi:cytochrome P450
MATTTLVPSATKKIPFIYGLPFIGSQLPLKHDRLNFMTSLAQKGGIYGFYLGSAPYVLLSDTELIHKAYVEHSNEVSTRGERLRKNPVVDGLIRMEGEPHRRRRKLVAPALHPRQICHYADVITQHGEQLQQQWKDGTVIDIHEEMASLAINILGKIVFDVDSLAENHEFITPLSFMLQLGAKKMFSLFELPAKWPTPSHRQLRNAAQMIRESSQRIFRQRLGNSHEIPLRNDLLSVLSQLTYEDGSKLSRQELIGECRELLFAGHDTTAISMMWTWFLLAQHPDIYQKVQQEVDQVLEGRTPQYADLERLPYCLQVYKEALRIYPPVPFTRREALSDIEVDGYPIPKGTTLFISPYIMHHKAEYFPDPERFDPERFSPAREKEIPRLAFIPFGTGSRTCIGNHFVFMEGQLLLATLAQRVTFALTPGQTDKFNLKTSLALRPAGKIEAVVKRR